MIKLEKNPNYNSSDGPIVFIIMDGVGIGTHFESDCFAQSTNSKFRLVKK